MPKNLGMNILSFITNVLIGLWIIPYLVKHIGVAAYGLVPLAMVFAQYIGLVVQSLNSSINRYLLIALQKNDFIRANQVFNTSFVMILIFVAAQTIIMLGVLFNLTVVINIPEGLANDALFLFAFTFVGFSISLIRAVISAPLFAHNRLDLLRFIDVFQVIIRACGVIIFFTFDHPELKYVGISNFIAALVVFFLALSFSKKLAPQLKICVKMIDFTLMKKLCVMSGWVSVDQIGTLLLLNIELFIANKFLGAVHAGNYAVAVVQWVGLLRIFAGMLSGVVRPVVMIYYSKNELVKMIKLLKNTFKTMAIVLSIFIGILSAMAGRLLVLWLGASFLHLEYLLIFSLVPLVISLAVLSLFSVNVAFNKVKIPGIVTLGLGLVNFLLAVLLVTKTALGLYGIILASAIILTIRNAIFVPVYAAYILRLPKFTFVKYHILGIGFYITSFAIAKYFSSLIAINSLTTFILISCGSLVVALLLASLYVGYDSSMRSVVSSLLTKKN